VIELSGQLVVKATLLRKWSPLPQFSGCPYPSQV